MTEHLRCKCCETGRFRVGTVEDECAMCAHVRVLHLTSVTYQPYDDPAPREDCECCRLGGYVAPELGFDGWSCDVPGCGHGPEQHRRPSALKHGKGVFYGANGEPYTLGDGVIDLGDILRGGGRL